MMSLREAAAAMSGELRGSDRIVTGVSTDTRALTPGELFVAIKGERFDAVRFVGDALQRGAAAAVVARASMPAPPAADAALIVVDDTRAALGKLAAYWRERFFLPLVGLTGSNGKTTVKDMIAAVLRLHCADASHVLATEGNLNNDIGVPLTLLRLRERHRYAVIEMGMNHAGEIRYLTGLARPTIALVNNAGSAHIGLLGSLDAIARAKGEIYEGLASDGVALINADDAYAPLWRGQNAARKVIDFGLDTPACVSGRYTGHRLSSDIVVRTPAGQTRFTLGLPGVHNVRNAIAAAAAAFALDVPAALIGRGLAAVRGPEGRLECFQGRNGSIVLDDTYNANLDSSLAAVAVLAQMPGRRVLVLGDMGELGSHALETHSRVGAAAAAAGIDLLITLGELSRHASEAFGPAARHCARIEDLLEAVTPELAPGTTLLVKGSRFMQMERVVQSLKAEQA
ncbi:MAG: UDP-N-acetylmuramoyl-tripeptide--D-alanyl-D-alanine ligase [Burkholderiales bacterium]|nr:UDP-N-acetylmuramoyl-tripeptide--D-alanyl-D-alanine ligase [Burkholderiales bacterium]